MMEVLTRNWKARLLCLGMAMVIWYLVKERSVHGLREGASQPFMPQAMQITP